MSRIGKFVQYRTIAQIADHVDCAGYQDITNWPTMDDAIIGAHEIAANSTRFHQYSNGLLVKWAIAQGATIDEIGNLHWRTIETIALSSNGARIVHIVSDKSGIPFDLTTDDDDFSPNLWDWFAAYYAEDHDDHVRLVGEYIDTLAAHLRAQDDGSSMTAPGAQDEPSSSIEFHFDNAAPLSGFAQDSITEDSTAPGAQDDGSFEYAPQMAAHLEQRATGISNDIRCALVSQLGYTEDDASLAMISWRLLDSGGYGWMAEFSNGTAHYWDMDAYQFVKPMPRVVLSPQQVDELLIQMAMFSDIVDEGMRLGDIQRCCNASEYVIAITRLLN